MKKISQTTVCVHHGTIIDDYHGINTAVYPSTAYQYLDEKEGLYPRYLNVPNQQVLVDKIAKLENAETGLIFSSGMAAISSTIVSLLSAGDHIIFQHGLYGGTSNFIKSDLSRFGIECSILPNNEEVSFKSAIKKNTKAIYIETPSNPLLKITNLEMIGDLCKHNKLFSIIDNTFASPINQNPLDFGIDVVVHSATKYLGGHSDITAGVVVSNNETISKIKSTSLNFGASLNPLMCHLLERSIKTLSLRVQRQNTNAMELASFLEKSKKVKKVYYPGLESNEGYEIAKKQMKGYGGMLSFELDGVAPLLFQKKLNLIKPALSLGGIESTICSPAITSHRHLSLEQKQKEGISDRLLRLSVGIEDIEDLINDIESSF